MSRVAFLVSHPIGAWMNGADRATLTWCAQLRARDHDPVIVALPMRHEPTLSRWLAQVSIGTSPAIAGVPLHVHPLDLPIGPAPRLADDLERALTVAVAAALAAVRADVVVVPWGTPRLARIARLHHDRVLLIAQNGTALDALRASDLTGIALATVSPDAAARLARPDAAPPMVLLNAIDPIAAGAAAPPGPHGAIGMVNLCAEKGAVVFLNVAANLPARRFVATGGWAGRATDYTAMTTGLANLQIVPAAPTLDGFYPGLAMLLVPSLCDEAFGRVVIEAQLAGVPVVCTSRCPARAWCGGLVVEVPPRPEEGSDDDLHDAPRHDATIRGFLDAVLTLSDPANHALVVEAGHAEAARYVADQRRSIDAFADWLGHAA